MLSLSKSGRYLRRSPLVLGNFNAPARHAASITSGPPRTPMSSGMKMVLGGIVLMCMYVPNIVGIFSLRSWGEKSQRLGKGSAPPPPADETPTS